MSLLTTIQTACRRLAIPVPTAIVSSTNSQVLQLWELANVEGTELSERYDWSILVRQTNFTTTATEDQVGSVPSDFGHYIIDTMYNRTTTRKCYGPLTSADWQYAKSYPIYTSINPQIRIVQPSSDGTIAGYVKFIPNPDAGNSVYYEYALRYWVVATAGVTPTKQAFTVDTDFSILDERIVTKGLVWRFKQAKGFEYGQDFAEYEQMIARAQAQDGGGKPRLSLRNGLGARTLWPYNVQEGSFPS